MEIISNFSDEKFNNRHIVALIASATLFLMFLIELTLSLLGGHSDSVNIVMMIGSQSENAIIVQSNSFDSFCVNFCRIAEYALILYYGIFVMSTN